MAEFTNASIVTIAAGQNVPFTETAINSKPCIVHREGAGIVTLRGLTDQCKAATVTPAAVENYFNIFVSAIVEVPRGCCLTVAAENTSTQAVSFANANFTVDRIS